MEPTNIPESSILIAHMGDIHLRDSQYANTGRSEDFFEAFHSGVLSVQDADLIVACGDIFDSSRPSPKVVGQLMKIDYLLQRMDKVMLCVNGNHDYSDPSWLSILFPRRSGPGIVCIDHDEVTINGFRIAGVPPYNAAKYRANKDAIDTHCREADVVLYHGFVTGIVPVPDTAEANPLSIDELPASPRTKAVLLADIHVQGWARHKSGLCDKLVVYPGSLEMCNTSESTEKSIPLIRVTRDKAEVEKTVPVKTRMFIHGKVRTPEELDEMVLRLRSVANNNPVVIVEFDRALADAVPRIHAAIDADKALVRCRPLPRDTDSFVRPSDKSTGDRTLDSFIEERLRDDVECLTLALDLLHRPDDAANIISAFIEKHLPTEQP